MSRLRISVRYMRLRQWCVACCVLLLSSPGWAQIKFVDDAQREVTLPKRVSRVFAAGAPAELLLYTLAPEKLVGRNHMPSQAALEFMPQKFRTPVQIVDLPNANDAAHDHELRALQPDIYVDYGDVTADYVQSVIHVQERTGVPAIILDGGLQQIPDAYRRLGMALGLTARGNELAKHAEHILNKYHQVLAKLTPLPRAYLACSADNAIPCLTGERNGEVMQWLGAINVAGSVDTAPRRMLTMDELTTWNPDVIVAANADAAARLRNDVDWQSIKAVAEHRVYAPPTLPYSWGPRPPSVNRLMGMIWLSYVLPGRAFDADFYREMRSFFKRFYHVSLTDRQLQNLLAS